jgi:hypothetical protein
VLASELVLSHNVPNMNRSTRFDPLFAPLIFLLIGCSGPSGGDSGNPQEPEATQSTQSGFLGEWVATDDKLGTMNLTIRGSDDDLECVLTDTRGKRFEFEESAELEDGALRFETELEVGKRGVKVLFNQPEASLEVAGDMNYAMGNAMAAFSRQERDGVQVVAAAFYRESRPEDTRRTINLIRVDRLAPRADAGGK